MVQVVAFANQKGGVAKTTSVVTLAAALAGAGEQITVVRFGDGDGTADVLRDHSGQCRG